MGDHVGIPSVVLFFSVSLYFFEGNPPNDGRTQIGGKSSTRNQTQKISLVAFESRDRIDRDSFGEFIQFGSTGSSHILDQLDENDGRLNFELFLARRPSLRSRKHYENMCRLLFFCEIGVRICKV